MPIGVLDTVTGDLPLPLGGGNAIAAPLSDVDLLIERLPFWLRVTSDFPYQRETAQFERDQVDQQPEAGEQSLAGWWTRSQLSLHGGAGLSYLDTSARPDENDRVRYFDSRGVDVWTPGQVSRLPGCSAARSLPGGEQVWVKTAMVGGQEATILVRTNRVEVRIGDTWTSAGAGNVRAFACDGSYIWLATIDGVFFSPVSDPGNFTQVYAFPYSDVPMVMGWVKQRLMFGRGNALYELTSRASGTAALPTPKYTHPSPNWRWSVLSDGPSGIIAGGYDGLQSGLFKLELSEVNDVPVLGTGVALLSMPGGERITSSAYYLGSLLILGTNRGVRVCPFESYYGTITLGPLSYESAAPVTALGGYDRFVYAGTRVDGEAMLVRLDLGLPLDQAGHYAYAPDLQSPVATAADVLSLDFTVDGRALWAVAGYSLLEETTSTSTRGSWLQTARIRMGTVEDKHFRYGLVRGSLTSADTATIEVGSNLAGFAPVFTAGTGSERFLLRAGKAEWVALRITLAGAAVLTSYQVQAQPAAKRQRLVSFPVSIADYQQTRSGTNVGYDGWALERLAALEAIEASGQPITVQAPALFPDSVEATIEKLTYVQTSGPADRGTGTAGTLQVVVRVTS